MCRGTQRQGERGAEKDPPGAEGRGSERAVKWAQK